MLSFCSFFSSRTSELFVPRVLQPHLALSLLHHVDHHHQYCYHHHSLLALICFIPTALACACPSLFLCRMVPFGRIHPPFTKSFSLMRAHTCSLLALRYFSILGFFVSTTSSICAFQFRLFLGLMLAGVKLVGLFAIHVALELPSFFPCSRCFFFLGNTSHCSIVGAPVSRFHCLIPTTYVAPLFYLALIHEPPRWREILLHMRLNLLL